MGPEPHVGRGSHCSQHVVIARESGPHYIIWCESLDDDNTIERAEDVIMAVARPKPQVVRLTEAAAERIKAVMAKADRPIAAVRVGVKNGGCAGMAYTMEYAEKVNPLDEIVEDKGVRILIDPKAVLFLLGTEMDYKIDKLSAQFVFNNPNQTAACGCGESVQLEPATGVAP